MKRRGGREGGRDKAKQTEPWHNLPSQSGAGEQREKVPSGEDHRRAEMKQETRSNLFVVAGTLFFSFLTATKIKRKERGGVKGRSAQI